jgi:hypothetical protein
MAAPKLSGAAILLRESYFFVSNSITSNEYPGIVCFTFVPATGIVLSTGTICFGSVMVLVSTGDRACNRVSLAGPAIALTPLRSSPRQR